MVQHYCLHTSSRSSACPLQDSIQQITPLLSDRDAFLAFLLTSSSQPCLAGWPADPGQLLTQTWSFPLHLFGHSGMSHLLHTFGGTSVTMPMTPPLTPFVLDPPVSISSLGIPAGTSNSPWATLTDLLLLCSLSYLTHHAPSKYLN